MKLEFLGTRGYIDPQTPRHFRHATIKVSYLGRAVAIDCGEDWLGHLDTWEVEAILVTHAHPDHAWGLREGAPCPVYATEESWQVMDGYDVRDRKNVVPRTPIGIESMIFEAFPVEHSTRAPAVGYRITAGEVSVFYVPDVVWIRDREDALSGTRLYIGDGATITRSMVRKSAEKLIGHTPIRTQLTWCQKEGVPWAVFTHCGAEIVDGNEQAAASQIEDLAKQRGVRAQIAYDGLELVLR
jgi:phosphoribosyl 1,2-cyclic phosphodiesterase